MVEMWQGARARIGARTEALYCAGSRSSADPSNLTRKRKSQCLLLANSGRQPKRPLASAYDPKRTFQPMIPSSLFAASRTPASKLRSAVHSTIFQ